MRLNNHGWGLREMIIYCAILLVFLLVAVFMIYRLYNSFPTTEKNNDSGNKQKDDIIEVSSKDYTLLEDKLMSSSILYTEDYYPDGIIGDSLVINMDSLIVNGYLEEINDLKDKTACKGYAIVRSDSDELRSDAYIKCSNFTSSGYQDWRVE